MEPSDLSFGALVALIAIGAIVATALTWDRWARFQRTRRVLSLTGSQLLVVLLMLVCVNIQQTFYTSWEDLAGDEIGGTNNYLVEVQRNAKDVAPGPDPTTIKSAGPREHQLRAAIATARKAAEKTPGKGVVVPIDLTGLKSRYSLAGRMYLPAAYFDRSTPNRKFPVIQFFSGYPSNVDIPFQRLHLHEVLDDLIAKGTIQPMIVVVPEQHPRRKRDSACVDGASGDLAETYLAVDVPRIIERELRVSENREHWTFMGFSTGGYCSVNLALRHSERYGNAISMSGNMSPIVDSTTGSLFGGNKELENENTPLYTVGMGGHLPLHFFMFTSAQDMLPANDLKKFEPMVRKPDTVTTLIKPEGGHNSGVWRWALAPALEWLDRTMPSIADDTVDATR